MTKPRWNANLHAFDALLRLVPPSAKRGLDVGCGEGETARRLRTRVPEVVGLDPDEASIEDARSYGDDITYVRGDLDGAGLEPHSFDVVTAVAMLHHVDHRAGLRQLADHVAPGGMLLVVGLAKSSGVAEYARDAVDSVTIRLPVLRNGRWDTPSPKVWPPPVSYGDAQRLTHEVLPDATYRRVPYFRYAITWVDRGA